jgi:hypothetical protein
MEKIEPVWNFLPIRLTATQVVVPTGVNEKAQKLSVSNYYELCYIKSRIERRSEV